MPVVKAWEACKIDHIRNKDSWLRPAFSQSEPWAGDCWLGGMGGDIQKQAHHYIVPDQ
jgi:hypothetical protein